MIKIETKRLILRNFMLEDVDDFYEYMSLESTAKYDCFDPMTYDECVASVKRRIEKDTFMAVVLKGNGKVIGDVSFTKGDYDTFEISYDFNEKFHNMGYATEASIAMLNHIFYELDGRRVYAECNDDNFSSIKLLERMGMRREGYLIEDVTFKNDENGNPIYISSYLYAILKREWDLLRTKR
jgi:ribosomal-protein-alanine N-acetyltransferase